MTDSPTASPTPTITATFTVSPTVSPTPIPTLAAMTIDVVDANYKVVGHFIAYGGIGAVGSISLNSATWVPESDGALVAKGDQGSQGQWNGIGLDGHTQLPNGYYHLFLRQNGKPDIDTPFWIKHGEYSQGNLVPLNNPNTGGGPLNLAYAYPETVSLEVRVYNLAGELVAQSNAVGLSGVVAIRFKSASGLPIAGGIYLVQVRGQTLAGGVEFFKIIKVAVAR